MCGVSHRKPVGAEHLHAMDLGLDFKIVAAAAVREREPLKEAAGVCSRPFGEVSGVQAVAFFREYAFLADDLPGGSAGNQLGSDLRVEERDFQVDVIGCGQKGVLEPVGEHQVGNPQTGGQGL